MNFYPSLSFTCFLPVAVSVAFYLLKRKTSFSKVNNTLKQIIIGVAFGAVSVLGTEMGADIGGAVINTRDAAPLCAGLLFGSPAGIIAGLIGGIERWFAVFWGGGMYSRLACSVSTVLCGIYAALLRKFMFDNKRPTWGFGLATAIVMEVIHLTLVVVTHLSDAEKAFEIVKICTLPMIVYNGLSVTLSIIAITLLSKGLNRGKKRQKKISQRVQVWLLVCVAFAYFATTAFVYVLQTNTALTDTDSILSLNIKDVKNEIIDISDENLLNLTHKIADEIEKKRDVPLDELVRKYDVTEINIVNLNGIITDSSCSDYIGFDMHSGEQSRVFLVLNNGKTEFVQKYDHISYDNSIERKYAGVKLTYGGFVQVGYDYEHFQKILALQVNNITQNRHIGSNGYIIITDNDFNIVSNSKYNTFKALNDFGINIENNTEENTRLTCSSHGEESFFMYTVSEGYYIIAVLPQSEAFATRDHSAYVNSYMEVLVFALLFAFIYFLIKELVVKNIRNVNDSLSKIIHGNLDVTVNVRSSDEFSSLSDDINSTVSTLKHYISEASARIDKELEFAKNIQHAALPSVFPAYPGISEFDVFAAMNTAKEVGGDFYDFYMLNDKKLAFLIADVSGKGIPAAMFMMTSKTMIKNFAETGLEANEVFTHANQKLCDGNDAGMFVTAWIGMLDIETGHITFANAGHNPPLVYRKGKGFEYLKSKPGFVLAGMDGINYRLQEMDLAPGDKIYLYTDGVTEATNSDNKLYGEERLLSILNSNADSSPEQTLKIVKNDIDTFVGNAEQFDDITMLMLEFRGKENSNND